MVNEYKVVVNYSYNGQELKIIKQVIINKRGVK